MSTVGSYSGALSKYKFKVLGEQDSLLRTLGKLTASDRAFANLKNKRIHEQKVVKASADVPSKQTALERLSFIEDSFKVIKMSERTDGKPKDINSALYQMATSLDVAADEYLTAGIGNTTSFDDDDFTARVKKLAEEIQKMSVKQQRILRGQGTIFNSTTNRTLKALTSALDNLDGLEIKRFMVEQQQAKKAAAAAAAAGGSSSTSSLDITV